MNIMKTFLLLPILFEFILCFTSVFEQYDICSGTNCGPLIYNSLTKTLYASQESPAQVIILDFSSIFFTEIARISTSGFHTDICIDESRNRIYIMQQFERAVKMINGDTNSEILDFDIPTTHNTITHCAVDSENQMLFVSGNPDNGEIYPVDISTDSPLVQTPFYVGNASDPKTVDLFFDINNRLFINRQNAIYSYDTVNKLINSTYEGVDLQTYHVNKPLNRTNGPGIIAHTSNTMYIIEGHPLQLGFQKTLSSRGFGYAGIDTINGFFYASASYDENSGIEVYDTVDFELIRFHPTPFNDWAHIEIDTERGIAFVAGYSPYDFGVFYLEMEACTEQPILNDYYFTECDLTHGSTCDYSYATCDNCGIPTAGLMTCNDGEWNETIYFTGCRACDNNCTEQPILDLYNFSECLLTHNSTCDYSYATCDNCGIPTAGLMTCNDGEWNETIYFTGCRACGSGGGDIAIPWTIIILVCIAAVLCFLIWICYIYIKIKIKRRKIVDRQTDIKSTPSTTLSNEEKLQIEENSKKTLSYDEKLEIQGMIESNRNTRLKDLKFDYGIFVLVLLIPLDLSSDIFNAISHTLTMEYPIITYCFWTFCILPFILNFFSVLFFIDPKIGLSYQNDEDQTSNPDIKEINRIFDKEIAKEEIKFRQGFLYNPILIISCLTGTEFLSIFGINWKSLNLTLDINHIKGNGNCLLNHFRKAGLLNMIFEDIPQIVLNVCLSILRLNITLSGGVALGFSVVSVIYGVLRRVTKKRTDELNLNNKKDEREEYINNILKIIYDKRKKIEEEKREEEKLVSNSH